MNLDWGDFTFVAGPGCGPRIQKQLYLFLCGDPGCDPKYNLSCAFAGLLRPFKTFYIPVLNHFVVVLVFRTLGFYRYFFTLSSRFSKLAWTFPTGLLPNF